MAVAFKEKIGTRFMIDSINTLMQRVMLDIAKTDVIDIAHVNFTPTTMTGFMSILPQLKGKVIDSFNPIRNQIIEENFRRMELRDTLTIEDVSSSSLKPRSSQDLISYINSLERGHTYKIASYLTKSFDVPFIVFLQLVKPSVNVVLGDVAKDVFKFVSDNLYFRDRRAVINSTDEYLFLYPKEDGINFYSRKITITEKDVNVEFELYPVGKVTWTKVIDQVEDYFLIPASFGTVAVMTDEKLKDIYKSVYETCQKDMNLYARSNWKTLKSFLK